MSTTSRRPDFTERELRAILAALTRMLSDEQTDTDEDMSALETARAKIARYREHGRVV